MISWDELERLEQEGDERDRYSIQRIVLLGEFSLAAALLVTLAAAGLFAI